ncbi:hypothetical protein GWK47_031486 [Chionoecetes opilio]|uniref:Uncharacterized protein n=1 Tax=Chionoecetes opilio TaxID=41210 RepID=A0A8J4YKC4_CHIOP|nr:hypothetical protein GWK47_031486 [Chionoecetes opilio]
MRCISVLCISDEFALPFVPSPDPAEDGHSLGRRQKHYYRGSMRIVGNLVQSPSSTGLADELFLIPSHATHFSPLDNARDILSPWPRAPPENTIFSRRAWVATVLFRAGHVRTPRGSPPRALRPSAEYFPTSVRGQAGWVPLFFLCWSCSDPVGAPPRALRPCRREYFPTSVRGQTFSVCLSSGMLFAFLALQFYSPMLAALTQPGLYWFYTAASILVVAFTFIFVEETKGKNIG